jgi:hypothetical protein
MIMEMINRAERLVLVLEHQADSRHHPFEPRAPDQAARFEARFPQQKRKKYCDMSEL